MYQPYSLLIRRIHLIFIIIIFSFSACSKDEKSMDQLFPDDNVKVTSIEILSSEAQVIKNNNLQLSVELKPESALNKNIIWSSSNESTATVNNNGLVFAKSVGTSTITVKSEENQSISDTIEITVVEDSSLAFVTVWKTDVETSDNKDEITIPTHPDYTYDYQVDWGDGTIDSHLSGDATHTYAEPGIYIVKIAGKFPSIYFGNYGPPGVTSIPNKDKLLSIEQWGNIMWETMEVAFFGCRNMDVKATDIPDLTLVNSTSYMFGDCPSLIANPSINDWDTSTITNMSRMFGYSTNFNQYIGDWDVSNVVDLNAMFIEASTFNQDIGTWDVSSVTNMEDMFTRALAFNQDIGDWNVSSVTDMRAMFAEASSFNQNIGNWDVGMVEDMGAMFAESGFNQDIGSWNVENVKNLSNMFRRASLFNQNIGNWDVKNVYSMEKMFLDAISFNQDLGNWDISNVNFFGEMFKGAKLSTENYDNLLIGWSNLPEVSGYNTKFHAGESQYCLGEDARIKLVLKGWQIQDGGYNCN